MKRIGLLIIVGVGGTVAVHLGTVRPGVLLFFVLLAAVMFSAFRHVIEWPKERADRRMLRRVDACLTAWAEHGDWNALLAAELKTILKEFPR